MSSQALLRLLELVSQSLLREKVVAIAALEELPMELFPPLFMAAFIRRHCEALKAMVQAWLFVCLPLGTLVKDQWLHQETLQAAFNGIDDQLAQKFHPSLDPDPSGYTTHVFSLMEPGAANPLTKRQKVESSRVEEKKPSALLEVLLDLCLREGTLDEFLTYLIKKDKQRKDLIQLCCKKLMIFAMPIQNIRKILKTVQLESVQNLEVNCTWKVSTLGRFASHLGQMVNLFRLLLSHIHVSSNMSTVKEELYVGQFTFQLFHLQHLWVLHLDSVAFPEGCFLEGSQASTCCNEETPLMAESSLPVDS
ncbi:melanoma antigen preferentially expressed in tumors-like [Choloepus didactylus]|uniref:melanoma antigen preferentially expressed in tumors-like n=1 Tax=Choloepus didactylus TaxID=27675 RepID=UPI00189D8058|nr:melanoma antigen preferentially expressed in tumors-like [Choloepus didactylus]